MVGPSADVGIEAAVGNEVVAREIAARLGEPLDQEILRALSRQSAVVGTDGELLLNESSCGVIGLPNPGCELKLAPSGSKLEVRVKGPNVTPGYWKRDDLTKAAFDEAALKRRSAPWSSS